MNSTLLAVESGNGAGIGQKLMHRLDRASCRTLGRFAQGFVLTLALAAPGATAFSFRLLNEPSLSQIRDDIYSAAWGDYDGDGRPDIVLPTLNQTATIVLKNTTSGFSRVTSPFAASANTSRAGLAWFDADRDGDLDLFETTTASQTDHLYVNRGTGTFDRVGDEQFPTGDGFGQAVTVTDFDLDGFADVFVANGGGNRSEPNLLLHGRAQGYFERSMASEVTTESLYSSGTAAADFDGDGYPDLFVANIWGPNSLFRNLGDGRFTRVADTSGPNGVLGQGGTSAAWTDWDNDGDFDLVSIEGSPCNLFRNDGNATFTRLPTPTSGVAGPTSAGTVCADFDNDGYSDILITQRTGGTFLFQGHGNGQFTGIRNDSIVLQASGANGLAVADYDADGDLDVLLTNWEGSSAPQLFRNDIEGKSWLRVRLRGRTSQQDGLGARIRVLAVVQGSPTWLLRQVGGYDSQGSHELTAHFGLGSAAIIDRIRVEWPSGITQELSQVSVRQTLSIVEPATRPLFVVPEGGTFTNQVTVTLGSTVPDAAIRYTLDESEPTLSSPLYSQPLDLSRTTTLKARLFFNGFPASDILTAVYRADPGVAILPPGGFFTNRVDVALATRLLQSTLHYTLDGTEPTADSPAYSGPFPLTAPTTVKTRAIFNGFPVSEIVSATFHRVYVFEDDGIPASWRERYFGADFRIDPRAQHFADPDRDGSDNRQEFLAGSDPLDPTSGFLVGVRALPEIRFPSVPGIKYRILRRASVVDPAATVIHETVATGETTRFIDESADAMPHPSFYLVEPVR